MKPPLTTQQLRKLRREHKPLPGARKAARNHEPTVSFTTFGRDDVVLRLTAQGTLAVTTRKG